MERLVMVHGRAPLCDHDVINVAMETAYPMGAPSGMNVSNVQHILCNTTVDTWIDDLQNMTGVNLTDIWPLMDQVQLCILYIMSPSVYDIVSRHDSSQIHFVKSDWCISVCIW